MSNYRNFIQDFPIRCEEILIDYRDLACKNGREVTHMFAIASAAITIPFARLREGEHPSWDKKNCQQAASKFANLCDQHFLGSRLWNDAVASWKTNQVKEEDVLQGPGDWITNSTSLTQEIKVEEVLKCIRNALAHGNIFTLPDDNDEIERIIFLSKIMNGRNFSGNYRLLMVRPEDFDKFLLKWVQFLRDLNMPPEVD